MISVQRWPLVAERDLKIGYIALTLESQSALQQHDYIRAKGLATRSLSLKPGQLAPLDVFYWASMFTGEFSNAADAAQKLLTLNPDSIAYAQRLADALAAERIGEQSSSPVSSRRLPATTVRRSCNCDSMQNLRGYACWPAMTAASRNFFPISSARAPRLGRPVTKTIRSNKPGRCWRELAIGTILPAAMMRRLSG